MAEAVVKKDSFVDWTPVRVRYHYKSKYPLEGGSARRRDHDFKIEAEAIIETYLPMELACMVHKLVHEKVTIEVFTTTITHYYLTLEYNGITYVAEVVENDLKHNPKAVLYRLVDEFKQVVGRRLSKRTIIEWLKMDLAYYFPNYYPEYVRYVETVRKVNVDLYGVDKYEPLLIKSIEALDEPVERRSDVVTPYYTVETPETFLQGFERALSIVLDRLTEEFFVDVYMFPTVNDFKFESGVERTEPDCNPSTTEITTAKINDTSVIEENTYVRSAQILRANNLEDPLRELDYWSAKYYEFLEDSLEDIVYELVKWYEEWYKEHFEMGGE